MFIILFCIIFKFICNPICLSFAYFLRGSKPFLFMKDDIYILFFLSLTLSLTFRFLSKKIGLSIVSYLCLNTR